MDFALTDDQRAFRDAAAQFARERMAPYAADWDVQHTFPEETLRAAAQLGFAALYVREDVGGSALGRLDAAIVFEELSAACPSTAAYLSIHNMVAWMIDAFGSAEQRQRFLPDLTTMNAFASYCLTEPGAGSDAASLATKARAVDGGYQLTGTKAFISGGGRSDLYLVMARSGEAGAGGISAFLVPADTPGLSFGAQERKLGWHSQPTAQVMLDAAFVPTENRLGAEGQGFRIAMAGLDGGRVNIAACSLGPARACLEATLAHLRDRNQFGRPLADFQALQFKLADMQTELEAARLLVHKAAWTLDQADLQATRQCAMAKRYATDVGFEVCNQALQLFGGYGYLMDYPIERYLRDVRVHQILEGTNEIMRLIIARKLLAET
ncbi:acyl-CoA dehydrogenase family protein [Rhodovibrio salinarum]|uniref:Acyl-CoA dehydrogenase n=1 Tax=Rhodovibrio salinarum TaxID=1087 RepID=A0A934QIZ6_9PROT|nr:acyl-CoA dehydrogenase family protein [Rhodovibrio salinarum]MBK1697906.1 acyl-CoA dehydrogenase [Rhodovibrio salinarum]